MILDSTHGAAGHAITAGEPTVLRLERRARLVCVLRRLEQLIERARMQVVGCGGAELLLGRVDEVDPFGHDR